MEGPLGAGRAFEDVARVAGDPGGAQVYEHGWQSWSPSTTYAVRDRPHRPSSGLMRLMNYRPDRVVPEERFQGEGLLAVRAAADGPVHVFAAEPGADGVPSIRARLDGGSIVVASDGAVRQAVHPGADVAAALGRWADGYAAAAGVGALRPAPTVWCSWYCYETEVTEQDVLENLDAIDRLGLPVDVVQLDDGYQAELGDWLSLSGRFRSLGELVDRIRDRGRRAGIWTAPFMVGSRSSLAAERPDWLVGGVSAGHNWGQDLHVLDVTHPGAAGYLAEVFSTFRRLGIDYFKLDFAYAGALGGRRHDDLPGEAAYRQGLRIIREAAGPDAYLLGCGAPILPSVGLVDAMRVGPDIALTYDPPGGDRFKPSQSSAALNLEGRAWQHGRFWVNDPDCLIARPEMERREDWADRVERYGGLRGSSDRLNALDGWGLETTRRLLATVPPPEPFA